MRVIMTTCFLPGGLASVVLGAKGAIKPLAVVMPVERLEWERPVIIT